MEAAGGVYFIKCILYAMVLGAVIQAAPQAEALELHYVFCLSAVFGGVGGFAAALREAKKTRAWSWIAVASSVVNMAALGASVSMFSLWWLGHPSFEARVGIIGACGILGIAGEPLLIPLVDFIYEQVRKHFSSGQK